MLYATLSIATTLFAAAILHVNSRPSTNDISINELWKIRAYQEDDARRKLN